MALYPRQTRWVAPRSGPKSTRVSAWFNDYIIPWLLPVFAALQEAFERTRDDGVVDIRDIMDLASATPAAALMNGINALPENTTIRNPGAELELEQTLIISNHGGTRLISDREPRPNGAGNAAVLRWRGEDGGRMMLLDECVNVEISGHHFALDTYAPGPAANVALDIDGFQGPIPPSPRPYYGMGSACIVRRCLFHAFRNNPNHQMLRISNTVDQNQEYHEVDDCQFSTGTSSEPAGTALEVGQSANAKAIQINGTSMANFAIGIRLRGGSAHMGSKKFCNFTSNGIDVLREAASEASFIRANSEHSRQFLVDRMGYGFTILSGTRLDPTACRPGTGYIQAGQRLTVEGDVHFDALPPNGARYFDLTDCRSFVALGLHMPQPITIDEVGYLTMPLEEGRFLISIGHSPIRMSSDPADLRLLPPIFIRGKIGMEYLTGSDNEALLDLVFHSVGDRQTITLIRAMLNERINAGRNTYVGVDFGFTRHGGGEPLDIIPFRNG